MRTTRRWPPGMTRLRPVIMTALAMIIGMLPMSLGLGEGGEQNAPLGRAVIGGLSVATFATLFFVPVVYSALRTQAAASGGGTGIAGVVNMETTRNATARTLGRPTRRREEISPPRQTPDRVWNGTHAPNAAVTTMTGAR